MKKRLLALVSLASLFVLNGCNGIGDKDTLLARIDGEKVYREDYTMFMKMNGNQKKEKSYFLYDQFYSRAALVSRALSEYPELKQDWNEYLRELDPRILTLVFQRFYTMERLTFSDAELRQFYDANRSLFPADSTGDYINVRGQVAEIYYASKNPEAFAEFVKQQVGEPDSTGAVDSLALKKQFGDNHRRSMRSEFSQGVLEKAKFSVQSLPAVTPREYYDKHKDLFMTVPGYEVYHIQAEDSSALSQLLDSVPSLEQFKEIAAKSSKNALTAKDSGYVGHVKKDFALPYGIGLIDGLSAALEGRTPGYVTPVLRSQQGQFHRFYLVSLDPSRLKPFERTEAGIAAGIKSGEYFDADSSSVLILKNGEPLFTEADLVRFSEKFVRKPMTAKLHENLVAMLAENFAYAELAKKAKLNHSWEYRALVRDTRMNYIVDRYMEKKVADESIPEDSLKNLYERIGSPIHVGYSYEQAKDDLRAVASFPMNLYKHQYYTGYRTNFVKKSLEQSISTIYYNRHEEYEKHYRARLAAEAYSKSTVHLYDRNVPEYKPDMLADVVLQKADSLFKAGRKIDAYNEYCKALYAYAENDSLFEKIAYEMALVENENSDFENAESDYYAFYTMWPNSVNAEKAMFSRGFILNENLNRNSDALVVLEKFIQKYPESELKESAQWLVDNIKSDGKLAADLMKKIEAEE